MLIVGEKIMDNVENNRNIVKKVSIISVLTNIFLLAIKFFISVISGSQAMLADSLNSAGDIVASIISYIGAKIASKPEDVEHPHGHGKAEYIFAVIISLCMIIASFSMIVSSTSSIIHKESIVFSYKLIIICLVTIITKFLLYMYTGYQLKKKNSILIKANNEDHRNDMFVTLGTLIGICLSLKGIYFADGLIGILISIWIMCVGIKLFLSSYKILMDTNLEQKKTDEIIEYIEKNEDILHVDSIISKPVGEKYIIIIKLSMDGMLTLDYVHKVIGKIKAELVNKYDFISDVIIHANPH